MAGIGTIGLMPDRGGAPSGLLPGLVCLPLILFVFTGPQNNLVWLVFWAALMAVSDLANRRIPNTLNALAALFGLGFCLITAGWTGLAEAALGGLVGFGLLAIFFFMGAVGGGDVKALGALATLVGPSGGLELFVLTCLIGGLLAVIRIVASGQPLVMVGSIRNLRLAAGGLEMPYGLAIFGAAVALALTRGL